MESAFPRHIRPSAHDWGQLPKALWLAWQLHSHSMVSYEVRVQPLG
jgi:hypothetical protein